MSRELNREPLTVERAIALAGLDNSCVSSPISGLQPARVANIRPLHIYFPVDQSPQDANGRDLFLGVVTDLLVNHLVYDRKR